MDINDQPHKRNYVIHLLYLIPLGVIIVSTLIFKLNLVESTMNQGEWLEESVQEEFLQLKEFSSTFKWRLILLAPQYCDIACESEIKRVNDVRHLMHKHSHRIDLWLLDDNFQKRNINLSSYEIVDKIPSVLSAQKAGVYLVDPDGLAILYYEFSQIESALFLDLKHLMKTSRRG